MAERGDGGIEQVQELTTGSARTRCWNASAPRTRWSRRCDGRPGGQVGWVGVPHLTDLPQEHMFWRNVGLRGGPAPVRAYLADLLQRVWNG